MGLLPIGSDKEPQMQAIGANFFSQKLGQVETI